VNNIYSVPLKNFLDRKVEQYNRFGFIESDPIQIPHLFKQREDIEIAGFLSAILAWGLRKTIIGKSRELLRLMEYKPYDFICNAREKDFIRFNHFCHRTFNATDTLYFLHALKHIYSHYGGLYRVFCTGFGKDKEAAHAISYFRTIFFETDYPLRTARHISDVSKGSAAKRLNMFLRWMVRRDNQGVDFGLWTDIDPAWLKIPLDLHAAATARMLGLLLRKSNDWKAVEELTGQLSKFDPADPVKYDFALFGIGAFESGNRQSPIPL
jgi:uncharacterized protein (TIGR02757 family)